MPYMELFDKDAIDENFGHRQLLQLLKDEDSFPIRKNRLVVSKQETLFTESMIHDYVYVIESGIFGAWKGSHIINFMGANEFIGMDSILGKEVSPTTVTALENSVIWRFSKKEVMWKLMYMQEGLFFLYRDLKRINENLVQRNIIQVADAKERVITNIVQLGRSYGRETQKQITLPKTFTKKIIANYLNLTSTTVYGLCKQMVHEGILEPISSQLIINKEQI